MVTYRCFLVSGERIQAVQFLECEDDMEATARGAALIEEKPEHQSVEIWQGGRFVVRIPTRKRPPGISQDD
jgi:hypothetical protein